MVLEGSLNLKEAAIETIEEQASEDTEGELYGNYFAQFFLKKAE